MIEERIRKIKFLALDVDGVLTDGRIIYDNYGDELKCFNVLDGLGVKLFNDAGFESAIITAKETRVVKHRAKDMNISKVYTGFDKLSLYEKMLSKFNLKDEDVCFMGDDILDIPILKRVGFAACPPNAVEEARAIVHYVTKREGGKGAVREVVELILKAKGLWDGVLSRYCP